MRQNAYIFRPVETIVYNHPYLMKKENKKRKQKKKTWFRRL